MELRKLFGDNMKAYRKEKNLSQEKFAELCGLHRTYIGDIERYRRNVSIDNIQKIAAALGISAHLLFINQKES